MKSLLAHAQGCCRTLTRHCTTAALMVALASGLIPAESNAQAVQSSAELQALTTERLALSADLEQYQKTLDLLHTEGALELSSNPAVKKLTEEMAAIKQRLVVITRREIALLQQQIAAADPASAADGGFEIADSAATTAAQATDVAVAADGIESKPLRTMPNDDSAASEAREVERLQNLLASYYSEQAARGESVPNADERARNEASQRDAQALARIPFSVDKVRLNGSEGSLALRQISQRLNDPELPDSRREVAPICSIKTYLFGALVGSESRSLKPVGKNHFVARIRLQPGDTTLRILNHRWQVRLPENVKASDFVITFYSPSGAVPELHVFAIDEFLAEDTPYIPAWLPEELKIKTG